MSEKSQDPRGLDPEEIKQLFQQLKPVPIPDDTRENIHALLLEEVSKTLATPVSTSLKPQFPLAGWLQRQFQRLPRFELGSSLAAAAMGAAVVLLLLGSYPYLRSLTTSSAKIVVLDSDSSTSGDVSVLIQSQYGESLGLSEGDEATLQTGDKLVAWSSNIAIEYADGWTSTLKAGSILDVNALSRNRANVDIELYLHDGEIFTSIDRDLGYEGHIAIHTGSSVAEAIGTEFVVRTDTKDISYLAVFTGTVQFSNDVGTVYAQSNEQVFAVAGQELLVSNRPEFSSSVDPTQPYITAKAGGVSLRARPDVNSAGLALMWESDRLKLVGASGDVQWYVVCCIKDNVLSWVNAAEVVPHNIYGTLPRFAEDALDERQSVDSGVTASNPAREPEPVPVRPTAPTSSTVSAPEPSEEPTEIIPPTSTPVATFTPTVEVVSAPTQRPVPPFLRPTLPQQDDVIVIGSVSEPLTAPDVQSEEAGQEAIEASPRPQLTPTTETAPSSSATDTNGSSNVEDTSQVSSEPIPAPTLADSSGNGEPEVAPTNTPVLNTPTSTRRPNTSTNTPAPPQPTNTPLQDIATNTPELIIVPPAVTNTAITQAPLEPTATNTRRPNTSTPVPATPVPATPVPATPVPPTPVPLVPTSTSVNTPVIVGPTNTPIAPADTPVPTQEVTQKPPAATNTATVQIQAPTDEPATAEPTSTPVPPPTATNTVVIALPEPTNTATPQIVEPTPEPVATETSTPNPKLTPLTEPTNGGVPTVPDTPVPPPVETPTQTPPILEPTEPPKIVVPTATPVLQGVGDSQGAVSNAPDIGQSGSDESDNSDGGESDSSGSDVTVDNAPASGE